MKSTIDTTGIVEFLDSILLNGRELPFTVLEDQFKIKPYPNKPGHRALKLWREFYKRWTETGMTPEEYVDSINGKRETGRVKDHQVNTDSPDISTNNEWTYQNDSAYFSGVTNTKIVTLEDALSLCKVDLSAWEVDKWRVKTWDVTAKSKSDTFITSTNYGVQVWFKRKSGVDSSDMFKMIRESFDLLSTQRTHAVTEDTPLVLNLADFHLGADIKDLIKTPDFDVNILVDSLCKIADQVNTITDNSKCDVYVNLLGDYVESVSGLNHLDTYKSIGPKMYGAPVIKLAVEVLSKFLSKINNLKCVNLISGNHDRFTATHKLDKEGGAGEILAYGLDLILKDVEVNYHPYLISTSIDGIGYLLTHGQFALNKKDQAKIIKLYGIPGVYTLWLSGHYHARMTERVLVKRPIRAESYLAVSLDEADYRKIILPSLFTGNFYSETLGYTSTAGYVITENNGNGKPNVFDYSL